MDDQGTLKTYGNMELPEGTEERPLVTFALFAYNQENYIREAVEGAFAQTYSPLEIILSDDCSSDRTFEIMQEMVAAYNGPHRLTLERTPKNLGKKMFGRRVSSLLLRSKGELIVLAAGDDISAPGRTTALFEAWESDGRMATCIHSKASLIDENGKLLGIETGDNEIASLKLPELVKRDGRGLLGATAAISKVILEKFGPLPDVLLMEDGAFAFRARLCDGILFVSDPLVKYRRHSENMTNQSEFTKADSLDRYVRGLIGQHLCYMRDYLLFDGALDKRVVKQITRRIRAAMRISGLLERGILTRIIAGFYYGARFSIKRRVWIFLRTARFIRS